MAQQTSIHVKAVKPGSEQHNKREKNLSYVRTDLSHLNAYWEKDTQANRYQIIKERYEKTIGQKMQAKASPIREAVVVIKQETTMDDLQKLSEAYRKRFGIDAFQIAIHKDEGYPKSKEDWKSNLHAHMVFDWTNQTTGKSLRLNRKDMVDMQTIAAEILQMDRGVSSDKQHLSAIQYKNFAEQVRLRQIEKEKEKKAKQMQDDLKRLKVTKARKEAAIETAKTLSEGFKGIFGQSSKDKTIKALRKEIFDLKTQNISVRTDAVNKVEQLKDVANQKINKAAKDYTNAVLQLQKETDNAKKYRADIEKFQKIPIIARCINAIRNYVRQIDGRFDTEDKRLLSFVMQEDAEAVDTLKDLAYYKCGVIGQIQYSSKWDQAERELRNIANGVREKEQQRNRGLRR